MVFVSSMELFALQNGVFLLITKATSFYGVSFDWSSFGEIWMKTKVLKRKKNMGAF
jgi:hypothetical protein